MINLYLKNPALDAAERKKFVEDEITFTDGTSGKRTAEYILGNVESAEGKLLFSENFWRSRFTTSCDPTQNVDINVEPGSMTLRYELNKQYNLFTGAWFWELKLINPDGSSFSYYRHPDPVL